MGRKASAPFCNLTSLGQLPMTTLEKKRVSFKVCLITSYIHPHNHWDDFCSGNFYKTWKRKWQTYILLHPVSRKNGSSLALNASPPPHRPRPAWLRSGRNCFLCKGHYGLLILRILRQWKFWLEAVSFSQCDFSETSPLLCLTLK